MKAVILAGGFGTRLSEETTIRPKPMVEIGGKPILWHIMNIYAACLLNSTKLLLPCTLYYEDFNYWKHGLYRSLPCATSQRFLP